ncbi:NACHT, LRR and PYD domains-containing protein 3-like [Pelodytes ibericus]
MCVPGHNVFFLLQIPTDKSSLFFSLALVHDVKRDATRTVGDVLLYSLDNLSHHDFKRFKDKLSDFTHQGKTIPRGHVEDADTIVTKNYILNTYGEEAALDVTVQVLQMISLMGPAEQLKKESIQHLGTENTPSDEGLEEIKIKYMTRMKHKYQCIEDRNSRLGETVDLNRRYTRLMMIKNHRYEDEREHELIYSGKRQVKLMANKSSLFYSLTTIGSLFIPGAEGMIPKTVVLQGPAGIGKTMTAQKIMLDWASGKLYQNTFNFVFYLSCRQFNELSSKMSIADVLSKVCGLKCQLNLMKSIFEESEKILFLIDGFDELKLPAADNKVEDHEENPFQEVPKEVLLHSLFRKHLLEKSSLLITTRPFTLTKLKHCITVPRYVEILGFTGKTREQYYSNFFQNKEQADAALNLIKTNNTLFTMCAVPIICWIICTVLSQSMKRGLDLTNYNTSTSIYVLYLKSLLKYHGRKSNLSVHSCIQKLCTLAKEGVLNQKIIFEEEDLEKHGLTVSDVESLFLNENIFQRDIETRTCYTFIHLSVQEFFAALYYVLSDEEENSDGSEDLLHLSEVRTLLEMSEENPHLTLVVRFLFGLSKEKQVNDIAQIIQSKISFKSKLVLEEWMQKRTSTAWCHNEILHCLYETQDEDFVRRMMGHSVHLKVKDSSGNFEDRCLSYCLRTTVRDHTVTFDQYSVGQEALRTLSPELHKCSNLMFFCCGLTSSCCQDLLSVITNRSLIKLDLTHNNLQDWGVKHLCEGLRHPDCTLQDLRLMYCGLTSSCCEDLLSVIIANQSLIKLCLSGNYLQDSGVKCLCEGLRHPDCTLQELRLQQSGLTSSCCEDLRSVIITNRSLTKLDLSKTTLGNTGITRLCEGLRNPDCTLQELRLLGCGLTSSGCEDLRSVIITNRSLKKLDLSCSNPGVSGVKSLCEGLRHPDCTLQELRLEDCYLNPSCCDDLYSVVITNRSLTKLDLSLNSFGTMLVSRLCEGLRHPDCMLQVLCFTYNSVNVGDYRKENGLLPLSHFEDHIRKQGCHTPSDIGSQAEPGLVSSGVGDWFGTPGGVGSHSCSDYLICFGPGMS